jgi:hypothetical protein
MRGRIVKPLRSPSGERALVAAIIAQALLDARRGNVEAADWLETVGCAWCEAFLHVDAAKIGAWRSVNLKPEPAKRDWTNSAERSRAYREKKRRERAAGFEP